MGGGAGRCVLDKGRGWGRGKGLSRRGVYKAHAGHMGLGEEDINKVTDDPGLKHLFAHAPHLSVSPPSCSSSAGLLPTRSHS